MNIFPMNGTTLPPMNEIVLLDTNVVMRLMGHHNNSRHANQLELKNFITKLAGNKNTLVLSVKTWEELHIIMQRQLLEQLKKLSPNQTIKDLKKNSPNFGLDSANEVNSIINELSKMTHFYPEPIGIINYETLKAAQQNSIQFNLNHGDSVIYTLAKFDNISHIVSCDADFTSIIDSEMNLYLDSYNYTKHIVKK